METQHGIGNKMAVDVYIFMVQRDTEGISNRKRKLPMVFEIEMEEPNQLLEKASHER